MTSKEINILAKEVYEQCVDRKMTYSDFDLFVYYMDMHKRKVEANSILQKQIERTLVPMPESIKMMEPGETVLLSSRLDCEKPESEKLSVDELNILFRKIEEISGKYVDLLKDSIDEVQNGEADKYEQRDRIDEGIRMLNHAAGTLYKIESCIRGIQDSNREVLSIK